VKNPVPLSIANAPAKVTNTEKQDSSQMLAVTNTKKETEVITKENKPAQQPVKNSEPDNLQKTDKSNVAVVDKKKETVAPVTTALSKPIVLKNDGAANVGGVQSSNGNNSTVNKPNQTRTAELKKPDVVQVPQKNDQFVGNKTEEQKNVTAVSISKPVTQQKEMTGPAKELPAAVADRKNETIQDLYFKNDSLILSLYDNGIVDGDTVSVFMNGENIISKQKLNESATKKTIYISAASDSVQLVLFAENLGTIPPNTGLLTVRDGDDIYQVRFSADLQKNASIMLRRKR
jgi:hypothetical protein